MSVSQDVNKSSAPSSISNLTNNDLLYFQKYDIIRKVGGGTYGKIYVARQRKKPIQTFMENILSSPSSLHSTINNTIPSSSSLTPSATCSFSSVSSFLSTNSSSTLQSVHSCSTLESKSSSASLNNAITAQNEKECVIKTFRELDDSLDPLGEDFVKEVFLLSLMDGVPSVIEVEGVYGGQRDLWGADNIRHPLKKKGKNGEFFTTTTTIENNLHTFSSLELLLHDPENVDNVKDDDDAFSTCFGSFSDLSSFDKVDVIKFEEKDNQEEDEGGDKKEKEREKEEKIQKSKTLDNLQTLLDDEEREEEIKNLHNDEKKKEDEKNNSFSSSSSSLSSESRKNHIFLAKKFDPYSPSNKNDFLNCTNAGGELKHKILNKKPQMIMKKYNLTLAEACDIIRKKTEIMERMQEVSEQLLLALAEMQVRKVMHRDIKPHNILFEDQKIEKGREGGEKKGSQKDSQNVVKIIDFGIGICSQRLSPGEHPKASMVCTLWYRPPELLLGDCCYDYSIDTWSVGVTLLDMFFGKFHFKGRNTVEQLWNYFKFFGTPTEEEWPEMKKFSFITPHFPIYRKKTIKENVTVKMRTRLEKDPVLKEYVDLFFDLIEKMLVMNPKHRISAFEALDHPFFTFQKRQRDFQRNPKKWDIYLKYKEALQYQEKVSPFLSGEAVPTISSNTGSTSKVSYSEMVKKMIDKVPTSSTFIPTSATSEMVKRAIAKAATARLNQLEESETYKNLRRKLDTTTFNHESNKSINECINSVRLAKEKFFKTMRDKIMFGILTFPKYANLDKDYRFRSYTGWNNLAPATFLARVYIYSKMKIVFEDQKEEEEEKSCKNPQNQDLEIQISEMKKRIESSSVLKRYTLPRLRKECHVNNIFDHLSAVFTNIGDVITSCTTEDGPSDISDDIGSYLDRNEGRFSKMVRKAIYHFQNDFYENDDDREQKQGDRGKEKEEKEEELLPDHSNPNNEFFNDPLEFIFSEQCVKTYFDMKHTEFDILNTMERYSVKKWAGGRINLAVKELFSQYCQAFFTARRKGKDVFNPLVNMFSPLMRFDDLAHELDDDVFKNPLVLQTFYYFCMLVDTQGWYRYPSCDLFFAIVELAKMIHDPLIHKINKEKIETLFPLVKTDPPEKTEMIINVKNVKPNQGREKDPNYRKKKRTVESFLTQNEIKPYNPLGVMTRSRTKKNEFFVDPFSAVTATTTTTSTTTTSPPVTTRSKPPSSINSFTFNTPKKEVILYLIDQYQRSHEFLKSYPFLHVNGKDQQIVFHGRGDEKEGTVRAEHVKIFSGVDLYNMCVCDLKTETDQKDENGELVTRFSKVDNMFERLMISYMFILHTDRSLVISDLPSKSVNDAFLALGIFLKLF